MNKIKEFLKFKWLNKKFWIRVFLLQIFTLICLKIVGISYISDAMALGAMGFISTLIGFNAYKTKNSNSVDSCNNGE